ncbi:hypothetical protein R83H12_01517 [Fibrobacteria bacterium R8-3-H12]
MKKGFGLLEVLIAAVVLGFLIVGLNKLQIGNREAVLRVRARDAANFIAQHVLDSLGSVGLNSIKEETIEGCSTVPLVYCNADYSYTFEGNKGATEQRIPYKVAVALLPGNNDFKAIESTNLTIAQREVPANPTLKETNIFAKSLEATVSWTFKNSTQSITMAKVVR